jgi:hypothetical protein
VFSGLPNGENALGQSACQSVSSSNKHNGLHIGMNGEIRWHSMAHVPSISFIQL